MSKSIPAQAAAAIKKELKAIGVKASVTSERYSLGSSISVYVYTDTDPTLAAKVRDVCEKYEKGMQADGPKVSSVHVNNAPSSEMKAEITEYIEGRYDVVGAWVKDAPELGENKTGDIWLFDMIYQFYTGARCEFWISRGRV